MRDSTSQIKKKLLVAETKPTSDDVIKKVIAPVIQPMVKEIQDSYRLKNRDSQRIKQDIEESIQSVVKQNDSEQKVQKAHIVSQYTEKIEAAQDLEEKEKLE